MAATAVASPPGGHQGAERGRVTTAGARHEVRLGWWTVLHDLTTPLGGQRFRVIGP